MRNACIESRTLVLTIAALLVSAAGVLSAQPTAPPNAPAKPVTLKVTLLNSLTGEPVPRGSVNAEFNLGFVGGIASEEGIFNFKSLNVNTDYTVSASATQYSRVTSVPLHTADTGNYELTLRVHPPARIAGRVRTEDGEPIPFTTVYLLERAYQLGEPQYLIRAETVANDLGEYEFAEVHSGASYLLMADRSFLDMGQVVSDIPSNPDRRRLLFATTYYPGADSPEGAQTLQLADGENRMGVDIAMRRAPGYCISGVLTGAAGPAAMDLELSRTQPAPALRFSIHTPQVTGPKKRFQTAPDGRIRLCGLEAGDWRIVTYAPTLQNFETFGEASVTITNSDVEGLTVAPAAHVDVPARVTTQNQRRDSTAGAEQQVRGSLNLAPLGRATSRRLMLTTEALVDTFTALPYQHTFEQIFAGNYYVNTRNLPKSMYVADITFGGKSINGRAFNPASTTDPTLRIILGDDGGRITVQAVNSKGRPPASGFVAVFPKGAASPEQLSLDLMTGPLQQGNFTTPITAPGDYLVVISDEEFTTSYESIQQLWRNRSQADETNLAPNGAQQVTIEFEP